MISRGELLRKLRQRGFDPFQILTWLGFHKALEGCDSILDVGCGANSNVPVLECARLTGIEGYAPSVEEARKKGTHDEVILGDVRNLDTLFKENQFDGCIAIDVIEHLTKEEGIAFAKALERIAAKKVVLFTPAGFLEQHHTDDDDLQEHLSGWTATDFTSLGFEVGGYLGPKSFRGEYHTLQRRPKWFWGLTALAAHFLHTHSHPDKAAALMAVKDVSPA